MSRSRQRHGFTLIELLIVIVIIAILAAIAIPRFASTKDQAKLAALKTDVRNYMTAQERFHADSAKYAASLPATLFTPTAGSTVAGTSAGVANGYSVTITNPSIVNGPNSCSVKVGGDATPATDGVITCP